ncbi:hypothetical protein [Sphingomonas sp.]|uniref:hypothetical protein n=1 Tax=Sphingomonas sp. TaxID=28214 RepID=UPI003B3BDDD3
MAKPLGREWYLFRRLTCLPTPGRKVMENNHRLEGAGMFIIWSGWGALTLLILGIVTAVVTMLLQVIFMAIGLPQLVALGLAPALLAAAALNWYVGKRMNNTPRRELIDSATGERVILQRRHTLFWIKMEYWSVPVALLGLVWLIVSIVALTTP